jgi:predicted  nucleic acid-binding Zn-ribbon protein
MNATNPLEPLQRRRSRIKRLTEQHRAMQETQRRLRDSIESYKAFIPEVEREKIKHFESTSVGLSQKIADEEVNKANLENHLKDTRATQTNPLVFWKFFTAEQKRLRFEANQLRKEISAINENLVSDNEALSKVKANLSSAKKRISEHECFDLSEAETQLAAIQPKTRQTASDLAAAKAELERIEEKIRPHSQELDRLKSELETFNSDIAKADRLDRDLTAAENSYERAMIHQECEEKFGSGSPRHVINDRRGKIRRLENNIPKLERRIRDELKKLDRKISHLVIDGNNVCYEGQSFIGLRGISALLEALGDRFKVTVVFDASIRAMLKSDSQSIEKVLGPKAATHVAPTKTAADEYLLKLAGKDQSVFILSNDRFAEYHDYDVVKSRRVLRFLIADGKLMANELDISISF